MNPGAPSGSVANARCHLSGMARCLSLTTIVTPLTRSLRGDSVVGVVLEDQEVRNGRGKVNIVNRGEGSEWILGVTRTWLVSAMAAIFFCSSMPCWVPIIRSESYSEYNLRTSVRLEEMPSGHRGPVKLSDAGWRRIRKPYRLPVAPTHSRLYPRQDLWGPIADTFPVPACNREIRADTSTLLSN
jgi:hypothetical protein